MQAYGTVASTVLMFIFTLASAYVYLRGPESEYWDIYCPFSLGLGFLGLGLFGVLGVLSLRFRNGLRGKSASHEKYLVKSETSDDESAIEGAAAAAEETQSVATVASNAEGSQEEEEEEEEEDDDENEETEEGSEEDEEEEE